MSALLLVAAVPFSRELEQTIWYQQRVQELVQGAVLASVVDHYDMYRREMRAGAGEADLASGAALEPAQEQEQMAWSVRQIGRDLRRIADELQASLPPKRAEPESGCTLQAVGSFSGLKACVTGVTGIMLASGLAALFYRFLNE